MSKTIYELHFVCVGKIGNGMAWFVRVYDGRTVTALPETRPTQAAAGEYAKAMLPRATCRAAVVGSDDFGRRGVCPDAAIAMAA